MLAIVKDPRKIAKVPLTQEDIDVEAELRGDILSRAHKEFGYKGHAFDARGPLAKALAACGIAPLDTAQVVEYKTSKEYHHRTHKRVFVGLAMYLWPSLLSVLVMAVMLRLKLGEDVTAGWFTGCVLFAAAGTLISSGVWYIEGKPVVKDYDIIRRWTTFSLGGVDETFYNRNGQLRGNYCYQGYIPIHVLNLALQVREACPKAVLLIDELTQTRMEVPRPLPDPFLRVELGSELYYIAVWDEREFEARA